MRDHRRELGAGPADVIDHLLIDAPPCAPDEERAVETLPLSPAALALKQALDHLEGTVSIAFSDRNVAAILELGGELVLEQNGAATSCIVARLHREGDLFPRLAAYHWGAYCVESREHAEINARSYPDKYEGWNEPPPPEKSVEQLEADARQAAFEAAERAAVLAAERELATSGFLPKKEAA